MNFKPIFCGPTSATFELENDDIYFAKTPYNVWLDGKLHFVDFKNNVFSIYDLTPDTEYEVRVNDANIKFRTKAVSVIFNIVDFISPEESDVTLAFQAAIMMLPKDGLIIVPAGIYHVKSLFLKSHMTLDLQKGATLLGSAREEDYPITPGEVKLSNGEDLELATWEGTPRRGRTSFISAYHAQDIAIVGQGTIDGQGHLNGIWSKIKKIDYAPMRLVFINDCEGFTLQGVTLKNSTSWTVHPYFSKKLGFYDIFITNPADSPNTDGLNPECCKDINIIGVKFSVGDDCIALKSGKIYIGNKFKTPTSRVLIRNCWMNYGHGAVVLGSEISAGIKDISVSRCFFDHTDRGLRIKTRRGRGELCVIDGVSFSHIRMDEVKCPMVINMYYFCDPDGHDEIVWSKKKRPVDELTPRLGSFIFSDIISTASHYAAGFFTGLPEMKIGSIVIKDSSFTLKKDAAPGRPAMMDDIPEVKSLGFVFYNVAKVCIDNVKVEGYEGERIHRYEVDEITEV